MNHLLNQTCVLKSDPTLDSFAQESGWGTVTTQKCRFVSKKRYSVDAKNQQVRIEAAVNLLVQPKLGDVIAYKKQDYKIHSIQAMQGYSSAIGYYCELILV